MPPQPIPTIAAELVQPFHNLADAASGLEALAFDEQ
jgi:hypothetical protein